MRCALHINAQVRGRDPRVSVDFAGIGPDCAVVEAAETMHDLVLSHAVVEPRPVAGDKQGYETARNPHLLHETAPCCDIGAFLRAWMAAAGVGPEATGVILVDVPLLQEEPSVLIPELHGNGAVQAAVSMGRELRGYPNRTIIDVDEDDWLVFWPIGHVAAFPVWAELRRRASQTASVVVAAQIK